MLINRHTLPNGLTLLHSHTTDTQMVAVNILYKVGARNESPAQTGFAHLFEHLMFGGSANIADYDTPLQMAGGENNAYTTNDITNYYITLPASNIETAFWLESDRMLSLAFTPESLEVQRKVVMEEFKQRYLNQPYGDLSHLVADLAYKVHPYRWPTIGLSLDHIANATMDDVKNFFFRFYAPNNAILSVVGNISFEETLRLTEKWFGNIPSRDIDSTPVPQEPPMQRQRRKTVRRNVPSPLLHMTFPIVSRNHPDFPACDMISDVLANGHSSRFYRNLVEGKRLFTSLDAYVSGRIDTGQLIIAGMPAEGVDIRTAEQSVWEELDRLCHEPVPSDEIQKVKNKFVSAAAMDLTDYQHCAAEMAYLEMLGSAEAINQQVDSYANVSQQQLLRVCRQVLRRRNSCILHYLKK